METQPQASSEHVQPESPTSDAEHSADIDEADPTKFVMKNGCCRECMRAFSKTGKVSLPISLTVFVQSCICQVPRAQRRTQLPENGCKYCLCKGCNPIDIRRDKRQVIKNSLKKSGHFYLNKKQHFFDSDDENLC